MIKKKSLISICMIGMSFFTNIAMLQNIFSGFLAYLPLISTAIMIICLILIGAFKFSQKEVVVFVGVVLSFFVGIIFLEIFGSNEYINSNLTYPIFLCLAVFLIGASSSKYMEIEDFKLVLLSFIISTLIVSIIVYQSYYMTGFQWGLTYSEYKFRGQLSQAIAFSFFALITFFISKSLKWNIIKYIILAFFSLMLLMMKCRAAIVEIVVGIMMLVALKGVSQKTKRLTVVAILSFILILLINDKFYELIINDVIFYGRSANDLDSISSGRLTILSSFPQLLDGNILFGIGNYYFECFTLNAILQYGIIVGTLAIAIGAYPSFWSLVNKENIKNKEAGMFLLISSVASFICGVFEAIAPVGPGIKFYILWLSFGFLLGFNYKKTQNEL